MAGLLSLGKLVKGVGALHDMRNDVRAAVQTRGPLRPLYDMRNAIDMARTGQPVGGASGMDFGDYQPPRRDGPSLANLDEEQRRQAIMRAMALRQSMGWAPAPAPAVTPFRQTLI